MVGKVFIAESREKKDKKFMLYSNIIYMLPQIML